MVLNQAHAGGGFLHQRPAGDHFADIEPGTIFAAEPPKRRVGNARHRGEDNGDVKLQRADRQRLLGECRRRHDYAPTRAAAR